MVRICGDVKRMIIRGLIDEDFVNYKKPSMFVAFPTCDWKCEKECGKQVCQNSTLASASVITIHERGLCVRFLENPITSAIVCGGLEPMDTYDMLCDMICTLRHEFQCNDDIVIYTGYTEKECMDNGWIEELQQYGNIIIKFGRYIPNESPHYDEVLGVNLASSNQYAKKIC